MQYSVADVRYRYTGRQKGGRGRPKELDGVEDIHALRDDVFATETVDVENETFTLHSAIVKCKTLKRKIKVVVVEFKCGDKNIRKILFSTKTDLAASEIFLIYHSRFQIEFLYRDATQNTGPEDWQSTYADRLSFGYNASLGSECSQGGRQADTAVDWTQTLRCVRQEDAS